MESADDSRHIYVLMLCLKKNIFVYVKVYLPILFNDNLIQIKQYLDMMVYKNSELQLINQ